jgi:hypothetical protein
VDIIHPQSTKIRRNQLGAINLVMFYVLGREYNKYYPDILKEESLDIRV